DRERSAASHALTLHLPLRMKKLDNDLHAVDGTPADCVHLALNGIYKADPPRVVVSGINRGGNLGDDVTYSGAVAAAREAAILGFTSFAISNEQGGDEHDFGAAAHFAARLVRYLLENPLPRGVMLNVNVPGGPAPAPPFRITRLGHRIYGDEVVRKVDPRGNDYYWIAGQEHGFESIPESDLDAVHAGFVSVTPIRIDQTDTAQFERLRELGDFL
ncbi:MAG: 5'/3'-nucleotidase SurE, partial [Deltaproteobacteria bacterium]|nr:5'/3'-nucleotidase SurE [Deltaproteobacteria bacterium]